MAPETAQDNLVYIMYVVNEEGWYSLSYASVGKAAECLSRELS